MGIFDQKPLQSFLRVPAKALEMFKGRTIVLLETEKGIQEQGCESFLATDSREQWGENKPRARGSWFFEVTKWGVSMAVCPRSGWNQGWKHNRIRLLSLHQE